MIPTPREKFLLDELDAHQKVVDASKNMVRRINQLAHVPASLRKLSRELDTALGAIERHRATGGENA